MRPNLVFRIVLEAVKKDSTSSFFFFCVLAGLTGCTERLHFCDPTEQIDFRKVGDVVGEWRPLDEFWINYSFVVTPEGELIHDSYGCELSKLPLVLGDYNSAPGGLGAYSGQYSLEQANIFPGKFELVFFQDGKWEHTRAWGELMSSGDMKYKPARFSEVLTMRRSTASKHRTKRVKGNGH